MQRGLQVLEGTDWSKLFHAYGRATDTPHHLRALVADDPVAKKNALKHLGSAIIHQGTPWTATGPAALVVAGIVFDPRIELPNENIRASLFAFLCNVADASNPPGISEDELRRMAEYDLQPLIQSNDSAIYENDEATNAFFARSVLGCAEVLHEIMSAMLGGLEDADHRVRMCAVEGATTLYKRPVLAGLAADLPQRITAQATKGANIDERCTCVLALGDLDGLPEAFLDDSSLAVRLCAALASKNSTKAMGTLIRIVCEHTTEVDGLFVDRPPQFFGHARFAIVSKLVKEAPRFDQIVDAAIALLPLASSYTVDYDWGRLLTKAFPDGTGTISTDAQRRYLAALVAHPQLWDPRNGNAGLCFKKAGLPYDRGRCAALVRL